ncbi:hypothetical protein F0562_036072 [Nyssa sinensis]|uniref:Uncharacterized protein n=1 Tax=Nyssa sinensis TaxID=561372 RepID=A0A5J5AGY1_9ASTE|nr:hypothetical protein F0562_036072 [Nyssa sinensis]
MIRLSHFTLQGSSLGDCGYQMDDSGHRENGRHKPSQGQYFSSQPPRLMNSSPSTFVSVVDAASALDEADNGLHGRKRCSYSGKKFGPF